MIDQENNPATVSQFFSDRGVNNQCFANGSSVANSMS